MAQVLGLLPPPCATQSTGTPSLLPFLPTPVFPHPEKPLYLTSAKVAFLRPSSAQQGTSPVPCALPQKCLMACSQQCITNTTHLCQPNSYRCGLKDSIAIPLRQITISQFSHKRIEADSCSGKRRGSNARMPLNDSKCYKESISF